MAELPSHGMSRNSHTASHHTPEMSFAACTLHHSSHGRPHLEAEFSKANGAKRVLGPYPMFRIPVQGQTRHSHILSSPWGFRLLALAPSISIYPMSRRVPLPRST